jgi:hypothetical protein
MSNVVSNINPQNFIGGTTFVHVGECHMRIQENYSAIFQGISKGDIKKHPLILLLSVLY